MRLTWLVLVAAAACAPVVHPGGPASYDDLDGNGNRKVHAAPPADTAVARADAPAGKGVRTGTIPRARLLAVLDAGPGMFLSQLDVKASLDGQRFLGWQLVQVTDPASPLAAVDVAPGDVLLALNGSPVARPDQLQTVWDNLRTANAVTAKLRRGDANVELHFDVTPKL